MATLREKCYRSTPVTHFPARRLALGLVLALVVAAASPAASAAEDTQKQLWPELDVFYKLGPNTRLYGIAKYTLTDGDGDNQQYGINLDFYPKRTPFYRYMRGAGLTEQLDKPVQLRMGYRYSEDFDATAPSVQNRLLLELSGRVRRHTLRLEDRSGVDFRWTDGAYSSRYRNRFLVAVNTRLGQYHFTPYVDAEWYYSITNGYWTSVKYEGAVELPVAEHMSVVPNIGWQTFWHSSAPTTAGVGIKLALSY
jgi:opacity protein-like surface antigen